MTEPVIEAVDIVRILGEGAWRVEALRGINLSLRGGELTLLSRDLSLTGVRLISSRSLLGQKVHLFLPAEDGGDPYHFLVRILWSYAVGDGLFVVAFTTHPLDPYRVMDLMSNRGWHLIGLQKPAGFHICVTLRQTLPATWMTGVGISFSFVAGDVRRAPRWMQVTGLEWAWRMVQEPRRLARRYLIEDVPFLFELVARALARRMSGPRRAG